MKHYTFDASNPDHVGIYGKDEGITRGKFLVGEDRVPRFFSHDEIIDMRGLGNYSGAWGYPFYESDNINLIALKKEDCND